MYVATFHLAFFPHPLCSLIKTGDRVHTPFCVPLATSLDRIRNFIATYAPTSADARLTSRFCMYTVRSSLHLVFGFHHPTSVIPHRSLHSHTLRTLLHPKCICLVIFHRELLVSRRHSFCGRVGPERGVLEEYRQDRHHSGHAEVSERCASAIATKRTSHIRSAPRLH